SSGVVFTPSQNKVLGLNYIRHYKRVHLLGSILHSSAIARLIACLLALHYSIYPAAAAANLAIQHHTSSSRHAQDGVWENPFLMLTPPLGAFPNEQPVISQSLH